jgi:hypothetical protein
MKRKPPDYKTVKLNLAQILKPKHAEEFQNVCNDAVYRMHTITREAMFFLKFLVLEDPENIVPQITVNFLDILMQSVCIPPAQGKSSTNDNLKSYLRKSYYERFKPLHPQDLNLKYTYLSPALDYAAESWITMIENNIKQHYVDYVKRYVNFHLNKYEKMKNIDSMDISTTEKKNMKETLVRRLDKVSKYLLELEHSEKMQKHPDYDWICKHKTIVLPNKQEYQENSIYYDIQCSPIPYLLPMIRIMQSIENSEKEDKPKLLNFLPTRHSLIPTHVRIDTTTIAYLTHRYHDKELQLSLHMIWDDYLRTRKQCFKQKGYKFNNSILTDGISCCLLLIKDELYGKRFRSKPKVKSPELYLDDLSEEQLQNMKGRELVGIDPNMGNLLFCIGSNDKKLRYTNSQRRLDMRKQKYEGYNEERFKTIINEKSVKQWEESLSKHDSKTLVLSSYENYLKERFRVDVELSTFYKDISFRKLSLHSYRNRKNSEMKFMRKFKETYDGEDKALICIGDWEQMKHRKFKEPVKGKGFRKMFRDHGYDVYLIDEHKTSKQCSGCKEEDAILEKFYRREYETKKGEKKKSELLHGLLKCTTCKKLWNRDVNASRNQRDIAKSMIEGNGRPKYLERKKKQTSNPI